MYIAKVLVKADMCGGRHQDSLAEWSKALAQGASPQGRGFEPHSCHFRTWMSHRTLFASKEPCHPQSLQRSASGIEQDGLAARHAAPVQDAGPQGSRLECHLS